MGQVLARAPFCTPPFRATWSGTTCMAEAIPNRSGRVLSKTPPGTSSFARRHLVVPAPGDGSRCRGCGGPLGLFPERRVFRPGPLRPGVVTHALVRMFFSTTFLMSLKCPGEGAASPAPFRKVSVVLCETQEHEQRKRKLRVAVQIRTPAPGFSSSPCRSPLKCPVVTEASFGHLTRNPCLSPTRSCFPVGNT